MSLAFFRNARLFFFSASCSKTIRISLRTYCMGTATSPFTGGCSCLLNRSHSFKGEAALSTRSFGSHVCSLVQSSKFMITRPRVVSAASSVEEESVRSCSVNANRCISQLCNVDLDIDTRNAGYVRPH